MINGEKKNGAEFQDHVTSMLQIQERKLVWGVKECSKLLYSNPYCVPLFYSEMHTGK